MHIFNELLILFFIQFFFYVSSTKTLKFEYHDEKDLEFFLKNFTQTTKNMRTEMYSIGNSAHKKSPLWVMKLSKANTSRPGIPNIKYVANIHGNEAVGREMLLHFMEYLRDNYEKDDLVKCLLDNSNIHLLPCMNPDGFNAAAERSCKGVLGRNNGKEGEEEDLNRNFPGFYHENMKRLQPETKAIMKWMDEIPFILSAGFYGGAMGAQYPLDDMEIIETTNKYLSSITPDGDVFRHLAWEYATNHQKMNDSLCEDDQSNREIFRGRKRNEASRYSVQGSMQDYNYKIGCMEVSLMISCCKYPNASELSKLWEQNKKALLKYALEALKGVSGQVLDSISRKPIENAELKIVGRNMTFKATSNAEFWRILLPGKYQIDVQSPGYYKTIEKFTVQKFHNICPQPTKIEILLKKISDDNRTFKHRVLQRAERSNVPYQNVEMASTHSRILNEPTYQWPLSPKQEENIYLMIFGKPTDFMKENVTEKAIRDFLRNDLGIDDTSKFDNILRNFDSKTEKEKIEILFNLGQNLVNVPESFTNMKVLRNYIRRTLGVVDTAPYEDILKNYDTLNSAEKKNALVRLLDKFHELSKNLTASSTQPTTKMSSTTASYSNKPNSAHFLRTYFSLELLIAFIGVMYIFGNYIHK